MYCRRKTSAGRAYLQIVEKRPRRPGASAGDRDARAFRGIAGERPAGTAGALGWGRRISRLDRDARAYALLADRPHPSAPAARIDAIAYDGGRAEVVIDWKSDIDPSEADIHAHAGQIEDYLRDRCAARSIDLYDRRAGPLGDARGHSIRLDWAPPGVRRPVRNGGSIHLRGLGGPRPDEDRTIPARISCRGRVG
jgi:hypothetical protein